jgi:transposase
MLHFIKEITDAYDYAAQIPYQRLEDIVEDEWRPALTGLTTHILIKPSHKDTLAKRFKSKVYSPDTLRASYQTLQNMGLLYSAKIFDYTKCVCLIEPSQFYIKHRDSIKEMIILISTLINNLDRRYKNSKTKEECIVLSKDIGVPLSDFIAELANDTSVSNKLASLNKEYSHRFSIPKKEAMDVKIISRLEQIRDMYFIKGYRIKTISKELKVSERTIKRAISKLRSNNMKVERIGDNPSWKCSYSTEHLDFLDRISSQKECIPLTAKERLELMNDAFPEQPLSVYTIRRMLYKLGYSRKILKAIPDKTNEALNKCHRILVISKVLQMLASGKRMLSLDEAVIDAGWLPLYGYSLKRHRAVVARETQKKSIYLIMAITSDGILAYQIVRAPINTFIFINFLITTYEKMCFHEPNFTEDYFLFLDNLAAHKSAQALEIMSNLGISVIFNTPYTVSIYSHS